jgi:4a-hydroxytetrahydrobiopterin dehydratase
MPDAHHEGERARGAAGQAESPRFCLPSTIPRAGEIPMANLSDMKCEACSADSPAASAEERQAYLTQLPDWSVRSVDGVDRIERSFEFGSYPEAVEFTRRVAALAEDEGHHPEILLEYGRARVAWWTHAISGLHRNDFVLAARTDELAAAR